MRQFQNDELTGGFARGRGRGLGRGRGQRWMGEYSLVDVRLVEPALLVFLQKEDLHGYALLEKLESLRLSTVNPSVIYRILRDFEDAGLVRSDWEHKSTQGPPRRVYAITEEGKAALERAALSLEETKKRIEMILEGIENNPIGLD